MKKSVIIISLQGLGNTIILLPVIKSYLRENKYSKTDNISLIVSNNGSSKIMEYELKKYHISIIEWNEKKNSLYNLIKIFLKIYTFKYDVLFAAFPSAKRENILTFLSRSNIKKIYRVKNNKINLLQFLNKNISTKYNKNYHDHLSNRILFNLKKNDETIKKINLKKGSKIIVGIHIGAGNSDRIWKPENFKYLIEDLNKKYDLKVIIFGGKAEFDATKKFSSELSFKHSLLLDLPLKKIIPKVKKLNFFIGNDSSFGHLAAYYGVTTITIWANADFHRTSPYGNNYIIKKYCNCYKKFRVEAGNAYCGCHNNISLKKSSMLVGKIFKSQKIKKHNTVKKYEILESGCKIISI